MSLLYGREHFLQLLFTRLDLSESTYFQVQEASAPVQVLPPRLKNLQDYHEQINNESNQWKDLHLTRKNRQVAFLQDVGLVTW